MDWNDNTYFDICVIGSGPAGIIVALEYASNNPEKSVILVEYGNKNQSKENALDNSISLANKVNHHPPYECTNKGLGGTSATWGGRCVSYDEVDFLDRPVLEGNCTWDLSLFEDVKKFMAPAARYFECGTPAFDLTELRHIPYKPVAEGFKKGVVTDSALERWSMPTRFGKRYADDIERQHNLTLLQGVEARDFSSPDGDDNISYLHVREVRTGVLTKIKATAFVLAAGAQETTRLLLRNTQLFNNIGGKPDALGKYYQGHLSGKIASVKFKGNPKKTDYGFIRDTDGTYLRRRFQFDNKFLQANNLLNTAIWLDNPLYFDPKHRSGAMSFMYMAMITPVLGKKLAPPAIAHSVTKGKVNNLPGHLSNICRGLPNSLLKPASIFYKRYLLKRKLPGVFLFSPDNCYALHFHSEQTPNAQSNMLLGSDGESLIINYELTDADVASVIKLHEVLDESLKESGCGELKYWFSKDELPEAIKTMSKDGLHQNGTTRIADSSQLGVVDRNLKVWGTKNVFVCSSSVFPTSGQANPTFFLGAFAVRLAHHLNKVMTISGPEKITTELIEPC
ncbi:GMC oxidoreductase [Mucilaginibacter sp. SP1R1]|uniref:GMC oxidoreductase n=1 Tax=Mucilaginibacter sp. SP1R1 TaxID=2723091 RepID=UPI00160E42A8|nr:GMC oxidoreductase [Mucilaginibacter sp. SP1R1]MBB6149057.1 choline dehydrogenase-like flavoprotein [Mucilaginibacter sp. SP1R1]